MKSHFTFSSIHWIYLKQAVLVLLVFNISLSAYPIKSSKTLPENTEPAVTIARINSKTIKKYEKFEAILDLKNVQYENPFDPSEIDVYAIFTSPTGKKIKINGFYDNYQDAASVKTHYLADAIDALLAGKSPEPNFTKAIGCSIK